jgi:hypothetical protein
MEGSHENNIQQLVEAAFNTGFLSANDESKSRDTAVKILSNVPYARQCSYKIEETIVVVSSINIINGRITTTTRSNSTEGECHRDVDSTQDKIISIELEKQCTTDIVNCDESFEIISQKTNCNVIVTF